MKRDRKDRQCVARRSMVKKMKQFMLQPSAFQGYLEKESEEKKINNIQFLIKTKCLLQNFTN